MAKTKKDKTETFKRTPGFSNLNPGGDRGKRIDEIVDLMELKTDFTAVRPLGEVWSYAVHWIAIETPKGIVKIPKPVPNFDPITDTFDETIKDPYMKIPNEKTTTKHYYVCVINRERQEQEPKKLIAPKKNEVKTGLKDKASKTWTPIQVLKLPNSVARKIQKLNLLNTHKVGKKVEGFDITDPKYGCDLYIKFDSEEKGAAMYDVQKGEHTPLSEKENKYLRWDLSSLMQPETEQEAGKQAALLSMKCPETRSKKEDKYEDEDESPRTDIEKALAKGVKKSKRSKKKGGKKKLDI